MKIILFVLSLALLNSCTSSTPAPGAPHATVSLRDGTTLSGTITASSPAQITLLGDDKASHTIAMTQVGSITYDQPAAPLVDPGATQPPANQPDATHADHYHPPLSAIQTKTFTLPAGALIPVRSEETIDAAVASPGQTYAAEVTRNITDADGAVVIPRGSNAQIIIRSASRGGRIKGASDLVLDLDSVAVEGRRYTLDTQDMIKKGRDGVGRNRRTAEFTGGGAVIGSIIGAIAGGGKGAAIGAASGAGAGAGTQIVTKGGSIRIPAETILTFRLESPLQIDAAN
ncbi:MAG: hypothetical protein M3O20_17170 [Acidobacteriota bacterium]|nr:hypothetical protein [Acidobacteriota bacterium]